MRRNASRLRPTGSHAAICREVGGQTILLSRPLKLVNLSGPHALANLGLDNSVLTARGGYAKSKNLSRLIFEKMPKCDGIIGHSRQGGSTPCVVLFDRCAKHLNYSAPDIDLLRHRDFGHVKSDLHLVVLKAQRRR